MCREPAVWIWCTQPWIREAVHRLNPRRAHRPQTHPPPPVGPNSIGVLSTTGLTHRRNPCDWRSHSSTVNSFWRVDHVHWNCLSCCYCCCLCAHYHFHCGGYHSTVCYPVDSLDCVHFHSLSWKDHEGDTQSPHWEDRIGPPLIWHLFAACGAW